MREALRDAVQSAARTGTLATAAVFLGPAAAGAALRGASSNDHRSERRPRRRMIGSIQTSGLHGLAALAAACIENDSHKVTPAMAAELNELKMRAGMTGKFPQWLSPEPLQAGAPLLPVLIEFWPNAEAHAIAVRWARAAGLTEAFIDDCYKTVQAEAAAHRGTPGGVVGKVLSKTFVPVAETVKENPALLFVAPVATAIIAGAASGAGAFSAFTGSGTAAGAAAAPATTTAAAAAPSAAAAAPAAAAGASTTTIATSAGGAITAAKELAKKAPLVLDTGPKVAQIASTAQQVIPKVVKAVNQTRTVAAIANGEVPPAPISLEGENFKEWAVSIARQQLESELQSRAAAVSEAERAAMQAELEAEVRRQQQAAINQARAAGGVPTSPLGTVSQPVLQASSDAQQSDFLKIALLLLPVAVMLAANR